MNTEVSKGAGLLDQYVPDWAQQINRTRLDMERDGTCVLAQVFGDYFKGLSRLELKFGWNHGFSVGESGDYVTLNRLWKEEIELRL